jgi:hypothetical protein
MAEVQTSTESGEMTQRFVEFVMMQAQNAALFMGQIPNPEGQGPEINLDVAKMFIDQLVMIRSKTNGNLSSEEQGVLNNAISNLQMVFVEVSQKVKAGGGSPAAPSEPIAAPESATEPPTETPQAEPSEPKIQSDASTDETESKKRFTKSYGS